ncbi:mechanosensitive ion channel family protein [bacterium]|nr:mechanosensitive ion channel family protein [bacterium]
MLDWIMRSLPTLGVLAIILAFHFGVRPLLERQAAKTPGKHFRNQIFGLGVWLAGLLAILLVLPVGDTTRGQLLGLVGIVLSAAIALSSTTLLGNTMAGLMLKGVRNFRSGDFIYAGEHFGRVSERGLFHTEIQNEDRELTTLPNLYLVTNPVTVVRSSGTIISAVVSLGYDVPRGEVEPCLIRAAKAADLTDPFTQVLELGDFSVSYRIAGLLTEVKQVLSARSRLRACVMDELHAAQIEIVSPNFMNTRSLEKERRVLPPSISVVATSSSDSASPESIVFDKAEEAASIEGRVHELQEKLADADDTEREQLEAEIEALEGARDPLTGKTQADPATEDPAVG